MRRALRPASQGPGLMIGLGRRVFVSTDPELAVRESDRREIGSDRSNACPLLHEQ